MKLPNLLLVSDQVITAAWFKKHLKSLFYIFHEKTEYTAIERLKKEKIDFIIIDGNLMDLDPIYFLSELKKVIKGSLIPILFKKQNNHPSFQDLLRQAGVIDFLGDSLQEEELFSKIAASLKKGELQEKVSQVALELKRTSEKLPETLFGKFLLPDKAIRGLAKAKQNNLPCSIAIITLTNIDDLHRRFGSGMEKLIQSVAKALFKYLRKTDYLISSKEGKFLLILPNTKDSKANALLQELEKKMKAHPLKTNKGPLELAFTFFITTLEAEREFDKMIATAGRALQNIHP